MNDKKLYKKLFILIAAVIVLGLINQFIFVDMKYFKYAMHIRTPKLIGIILASFCIGTASMVFQSIINNRIVTPCLLGMNSLYMLIHTLLVFVLTSDSFIVRNEELTYLIDIVIMTLMGKVIYGTLFKKTNYNVTYILLAGTVIASFFSSISDTFIRVMDPNEYDALLRDLFASFDYVNTELIIMSLVLIALVIIIFRKDIKLLDVITLGKNQAINLGVDYDRTVSRLLVGVTFFIAIATALVGPISFLGLIIANLSREYFPTYKHRFLMIGAVLMGMITLFISQILVEHVFGFGTEISVFISIFGGGYFLYLLLKQGNGK